MPGTIAFLFLVFTAATSASKLRGPNIPGPCGANGQCPDGNTCCNTAAGLGCCPLPNAVCCTDSNTCCASGTTCDPNDPNGCARGDTFKAMLDDILGTQPSQTRAKIRATQPHSQLPVAVKAIPGPCGANGQCPDGDTCCNTAAGVGCCPLPNAVCCTDSNTCCASGTTCDPNDPNGCTRGDTFKAMLDDILGAQPSQTRAKIRATQPHSQLPVAVKAIPGPCGANGQCPDGNTCCNTAAGVGCCPLPNAVCCTDSNTCCASGTTCDPNDPNGCTRGDTFKAMLDDILGAQPSQTRAKIRATF